MSYDKNVDPAKESADPKWYSDKECYPIAGPGGRTTNIENNEKGILDGYVLKVASAGAVRSDLGAMHPRVGIYAEGNTD